MQRRRGLDLSPLPGAAEPPVSVMPLLRVTVAAALAGRPVSIRGRREPGGGGGAVRQVKAAGRGSLFTSTSSRLFCFGALEIGRAVRLRVQKRFHR
ncbi:hypothetical protein SKAU_G00158210 [Synaphobranchus kaupii]|uniref:Uncharacterized protein n=1 Tax=Synaphobranchus kaupii TaxID=118154 RepID=A0A9Q1IYL8_SYNKA|nr:hypothetical protein SKAU_G00158210 [Synaphobranchus kaupii]